jgi:methylthioribulose-1-phosphate dehydratase
MNSHSESQDEENEIGKREMSDQKTRELICELCRQFYTLGWVSGTGGGISIKDPATGKVLVAPSGVQKERIQPDDLFVLDPEDQNKVVEPPRCDNAAKLKQSECTPLFYNAFTLRGAAACIHTHSRQAVLLSMMLPPTAKAFQITRVEMIKGIKKATTKVAHRYDEVLSVPIIDNTNFERELTEGMAAAMKEFPDAYAVIVRRHGVYIWGDTWENAKTQAECYDYLFSLAVDMISRGIALVPPEETLKKGE